MAASSARPTQTSHGAMVAASLRQNAFDRTG